jgi:hypothetical protein
VLPVIDHDEVVAGTLVFMKLNVPHVCTKLIEIPGSGHKSENNR